MNPAPVDLVRTRYLIEFNAKHEWYSEDKDDALTTARKLEEEHGNVALFEITERDGKRESSTPVKFH